MDMDNSKKDETFRKIGYLRQGESRNYDYWLNLPEPLASWDVFDYWERPRIESMRDHLKRDDILYDVGAEHGWMSVVFAQMARVFLIEPTPEFWPNIYNTWYKNISYDPAGCFCGLISDETNFDEKIDYKVWPDVTVGPMIDKNKYLYIDSHEKNTRIITLDELAMRSHIYPTALTIDIEGAELQALYGARELLKTKKPLIWVSIHPDLMEKYDATPLKLIEWMEIEGYKYEFLGADHERHYFFSPI